MRLLNISTHYRSSLILLFALGMGAMIGIYFPDVAHHLAPIGQIFINLLFMIVVPLVSLSVTSSIASMTDLKKLGVILLAVIGVSAIMAIIPSLTMISLASFYDPAQGVTLSLKDPISTDGGHMDFVKMLTTNDFVELLSKSNILALVIISIIAGIAIGQSGEHGRKVAAMLQSLNVVTMKMVSMIMIVAPIGLGCYFAATMANQDPELLTSFARAIFLFFIAALIYFIIGSTLYAALAGGRPAISRFWQNVFPSAATALGTSSSLASLPVNLRSAQKMGLKEEIAEICLPLLVNINKGGAAMTATLKVVFIYAVLGLDFSPEVFFMTLLLATLYAVIVSGVPGGAFLGEIFIVTALGLPMEVIPMLVVIGATTDAMATVINVTHDLSATQLIEKILGKRLTFYSNNKTSSALD
ncbi:dicarboxylate/amino acid:cation symporter [uncultured Shewanella sp.]|uniref:dicarboxylate/amino acid:cation symporter n=1 Tax=uncultured Shewanella sp. TaxID=173975 RepID=UPI00260DD4B0|nr:dicarboxylate/amino acid:cation symporter [uncultured Shewanella sp.]